MSNFTPKKPYDKCQLTSTTIGPREETLVFLRQFARVYRPKRPTANNSVN